MVLKPLAVRFWTRAVPPAWAGWTEPEKRIDWPLVGVESLTRKPARQATVTVDSPLVSFGALAVWSRSFVFRSGASAKLTSPLESVFLVPRVIHLPSNGYGSACSSTGRLAVLLVTWPVVVTNLPNAIAVGLTVALSLALRGGLGGFAARVTGTPATSSAP